MENENNNSSVVVENQTQHDIGNAGIPASSDVRENNSVSADYRKLFVGGLHRETGDQELRDHFGKYGEIEHIKIKTDLATGISRGFAFIVFKSSEALSKVEAAGDHVINGKKVDPKKAKIRQGKIFVGGLSSDLTDEDIKTHFAQFGTIVEAHMPFDKTKNQRKGFCFIVFESEEVVRTLLKQSKQNIKGKEVDVKRAESKPEQPGGLAMRGRGGRGGMRSARGGEGGYEMPGFNNRNFGGYGQAYNYQESIPNQRGGSMMRGRGGRGGIRGARGGLLEGHGVQGFNQGNGQGVNNFGDHGQAYDYNGSAAYRGGRGGYGQRYQPY